jgi:hypothetical protein
MWREGFNKQALLMHHPENNDSAIIFSCTSSRGRTEAESWVVGALRAKLSEPANALALRIYGVRSDHVPRLEPISLFHFRRKLFQNFFTLI